MKLFYWQEKTSLGLLTVVTADEKCCHVAFPSKPWGKIMDWLTRVFPDTPLKKDKRAADPVLQDLADYLAGNLQVFSTPLLFKGTPFQKKVWQELVKVPFGKTASYGDLACRTNSSPRAVGGAMGANPVAIIAPCHRVIGTDGSLTGFGGGFSVKKKLLEIENIIPGEGEKVSHWLSRHQANPRYLGNRAKKTFCRPDCPIIAHRDLRQTIPALFNTTEEAEASGYKPCRHCLG